MTEHPPGPEELRPSDADRKVIADQLRRAVDEGRLSLTEYDDRLREAYAAKTYGALQQVISDLPASAQPDEQVLVQIGDIAVTSTTIYTPAGPMPLKGSVWTATDQWMAQRKIPTWAIVMAIVGAFVICLLSLLFLLAKETVYHGGIQVTVTSGGRSHTTFVPIHHHAQVHHVHQQVQWLRSAAQ